MDASRKNVCYTNRRKNMTRLARTRKNLSFVALLCSSTMSPLAYAETIIEDKTFNGTGTTNFTDDTRVLDCDFLNNAGKDGGAVYASNIALTIIDTDFEHSGASGSGGAIYAEKTTLNIDDSDFERNAANDNGGAIYNSNGSFTINDTEFVSNKANNGGAIYTKVDSAQELRISNSKFVGNSAEPHNGVDFFGGAFYQDGGTLTVVNTEFINNKADYAYQGDGYGGAIGVVSGAVNISGSRFTGNYAKLKGGAIYIKKSTGSNLSADFTGNCAADSGGAVSVFYASINAITGNFVRNSAKNNGAAIHNDDAFIGYIDGTFTNNTAGVDGGAIYNDSPGEITTIANATFVANTAGGNGGAIYNAGTVTSVIGIFSNNKVGGDGGAIYNSGTMTGAGRFTNNAATTGSGGAIYNSGTLNLGASVFEGNADASGSNAIYNAGEVVIEAGNYKVIFNDAVRNVDENKYVRVKSGTMELNNTFYGGVLSVANGAILKLGASTANSTTTYGGFGADTTGVLPSLDLGGILDTENGRIETHDINSLATNGAKIVVDMDLNNRSRGEYQADLLHADRFNGETYSLSLSGVNLLSGMPTASSGFVRLLASPELSSVWESFTIGDYYVLSAEGMLTFTKSSTTIGAMDFTWDNTKAYSLPNAVSATGKTSVQYNLTADEVVTVKLSKQEPTNLVIKGDGASTVTAINNAYGIITSSGHSLTITDVKDFTGFSNYYSGGMLENNGALTVSNTGFSNNSSTDNTGGAIYNGISGTATLTNVTMTGNHTLKQDQGGGAIYNIGTISSLSGTFSDNGATMSNGGAVYNGGTIDSLSGIFTCNRAGSYGGAIANTKDLTIVANEADTVFTGNTDSSGSNALYNANNSTVSLIASVGNKIVFNDAISGEGSSSTITLVRGTTQLNNTLSGNTLKLESQGTLELGSNTQNGIAYTGTLDSTAYLLVNGGTVSLQNGEINSANLGNLTLNSDLRLKLDANLLNQTMDTITVSAFTDNGHKIKISNITILQPTDEKTFSISPIGEISDATLKEKLAAAIQYTGGEIVYSPIYKYSATYDPPTATFTFYLTNEQEFTPSVMLAPVATQAAYLNQLNLYESAFENMDRLLAEKMAALADAQENENVGEKIVWARAYGSTEDIGFQDGLNVSNDAYGVLFGMDSKIYKLKDSWNGMLRAYAGYNGSSQEYDDVKISQDGWNIGFAGMVAKNNFFVGLTATAGMSFGDASTSFGNEDLKIFAAGVASKAGYNFKFSEGKYVLQPALTASYSYIYTKDYTGASNVRIASDPLHAIQLEPEVKFIARLSDGWRPYAGIGIAMSFFDETQFDANEISLPEISVDPYLTYRLGVTKSFTEELSAHVQVYATSGGREGFGLNASVSYAW